jgi:hypothetical protein
MLLGSQIPLPGRMDIGIFKAIIKKEFHSNKVRCNRVSDLRLSALTERSMLESVSGLQLKWVFPPVFMHAKD